MKTFSNQLHGPSSIVRVLAQCHFTAGVKVWKLAWWSTSPVFQHALIICYFVIGCASPIFQEHLSPLYANRQMFDCLRVLKLMATHQALRVFKESIICRCLHVRQTTDIQTRIKPYPQKVSKWLVWLKPCKVISGNFKSEPFFKSIFCMWYTTTEFSVALVKGRNNETEYLVIPGYIICPLLWT